ncbi:MAG: hypothetical protein Q4C63_10075 [Eubacteriales bacterium]|nr:hypothetical protein [Eubacteriales bacterium]
MAKSTGKEKENRSRSWFVVCPNIRKNGVMDITPEEILKMSEAEICKAVVEAWCSSEKRSAACNYCISAEGMEHLHVVLCNQNAVDFNTVQKFIGKKAHCDASKGTKSQIEDYINKVGKFEEKGEKIVAKEQKGEIIGKQGQRNDLAFIMEKIEEGMTWKEIRRLSPNYFDNRMTTIIKNMYFDKRERETPFKRNVAVHWFFGESGNGKTGITLDLIEEYGEEDVYLVSDYQNGFDNYAGQRILVLDEFRGQLPFAVLLGILEGYKKEIHARYANVIGLWTDVYITTVKTPEQVYKKMVEYEDTTDDPISQLLNRLTDISYCYRVKRADGSKTDRDGDPCEFLKFTLTGKEYREIEGNRAQKMRMLATAHYCALEAKPGDISLGLIISNS